MAGFGFGFGAPARRASARAGLPSIAASSSVTLDALTSASTGALAIAGQGGVTLDDFTTASTATIANPPGPTWANVKLLMGFDNGADGTNSFVDESSAARTMTAVTAAAIDTAQKKFGTGSLLPGGGGSYVSASDSADFDFGSGTFTVEGWLYLPATISDVSDGGLVGQSRESSNSRSWAVRMFTSGTELGVTLSSDGVNYGATIKGAHGMSGQTWFHWAVCRDGSGVVRVFANGAMIASGTYASALFNSTTTLNVGADRRGASVFSIGTGQLDEIRVVKGEALYTSDAGLTVPTAAFPRS